jgi:hypothetical protein
MVRRLSESFEAARPTGTMPRRDCRNDAGAFWLGRLPDTGQGGKRILRAGRWQGLVPRGTNPECFD